jgi:hypothetical protein
MENTDRQIGLTWHIYHYPILASFLQSLEFLFGENCVEMKTERVGNVWFFYAVPEILNKIDQP